MKPRSRIAKGKELENFIVHWLRNTGLDKDAMRTPGSGSGRFKGDIYTPNLPIVLECKNHKTPHVAEWIKQADDQTFGYQPWAVIWHPTKVPMESSVAIVPLDIFKILLRHLQRPTGN